MKRYLFLIMIFSANLYAQADTLWTKTFFEEFGADGGYSVIQATDGNYIVAGYRSDYINTGFAGSSENVWLIKTDVNGNTLWKKNYGDEYSYEYGRSVLQTTDGGYIIAGDSGNYADTGWQVDVYLVKTDANGNALWTKAYDADQWDEGHSIVQTTDGGYIIAGYTGIGVFGSDSSDVWLLKTDANGDTLWTRTYDGEYSLWNEGNSVLQTSDGGYIIAGLTTYPTTTSKMGWLIKTDANGDTLWTRTYGFEYSSCDKWNSVLQTDDDGYIITGSAIAAYGAGGPEVYLIKTDANGDTLWTRIYGGSNDDIGFSVTPTDDGGYIIAGETKSFSVGAALYLIKTDANGDTLWTRTYGGATDCATSADCAYSVIQTGDGSYIVTGTTHSFASDPYYSDVWLLKLSSQGIEEKSKELKVESLEFKAIGENIYLSTPYKIEADIRVYDLSGRLNDIVYSGVLGKGEHIFTPEIKSKGIYFVVLRTDNLRQSVKIIRF